MSKSIRSSLIGMAPMVLLVLATQVRAQATDVDCNGCVDTDDIAFQAVSTGKIEPKAVTTGKIGPKAVTNGKIGFQAVSTNKIKPDAITTGKISDGAVTVDKLSPNVAVSLVSGDVSFKGLFVSGRIEGPRLFLTDESISVDTSECSRWMNFRADLRGGNFKTITMSGTLGGPFTCTDPVQADLIADALNSGTTTNIACDGNAWITTVCGPGVELGINGPACTCSTQPVMRPCIGNDDWGSFDGVSSCNAPNQGMDLLFQR